MKLLKQYIIVRFTYADLSIYYTHQSAGNPVSQEKLSTPTSCDSYGNSLENKLAGTTERNNILYGSTPITAGRFFQSNNRDYARNIGDVFKNNAHSINQLEFHGFNYDLNHEPVEDEYVGPAMSLVNIRLSLCKQFSIFFIDLANFNSGLRLVDRRL